MADLLCLVIEDVALVRNLIARVLGPEGYSVKTVADGHEARSFLSQNSRLPDLVLSDLNLAGESGLDLAHEIRTLYQIPVLLMSGQADWEPAPEFTFLAKPFTARELISSVRACPRPPVAPLACS